MKAMKVSTEKPVIFYNANLINIVTSKGVRIKIESRKILKITLITQFNYFIIN